MKDEFVPKYKVGDVISWFCNNDGKVHCGKVEYVNKAVTATCVQICYEIEDELFGFPCTFFVDEGDVFSPDEGIS